MASLSETEKGYVAELRHRVKDQLSPKYDTDFNLLRWIIDAERTSKGKNGVELAAKNLKNHLRFRQAMKLDEGKLPSLDDNPMFVERYSPKVGVHYLPSLDKFLLIANYGSFDTVGVLHKLTTTEMLMYNFYLYEYLLKLVSAKEKETGRRHGMYSIMNIKDYEMNPWTIMFASNGQLAQLMKVFGYEHYPELIFPFVVINTPKWFLWPVKLIKSAMPKDFNDRFQFYDHRYTDALQKEIPVDELPRELGGKNLCINDTKPVDARRLSASEYYQHKTDNDASKSSLAHFHLHVGQGKAVPIRNCVIGAELSWFFSTDGDIHFGVFFDTDSTPKTDLDELKMVHPYFRLGAKLVPERGSLICEENGTYYFVFCNKHSWFYKRNVYAKLEIDGVSLEKKLLIESAYAI